MTPAQKIAAAVLAASAVVGGAIRLSASSAPPAPHHRAIVVSDPHARKAFDAIKNPTPAQERMFEDSNDLNTPATP